ncbi:hypothetical protein JAAARDRAFT_119592 [Jaapia argillacea MUCL 33604]|uniref:MYND-type domain-containing protein n=1 Tax=Jaapia argillacea MUCL 33604 TaxID=933084 RepID=A0A067QCE4_9AGAM|nr:hypothetical protein JAAARDRAFT_119592 [Jaapia argillacea MUCL 33604]
MVCSACKSTVYCSKECQKKNWKNGRVPRAPSHKQLCSSNKIHMQKVPMIQNLLTQFPWGRVESDGSFSDDIVRSRFKLLGGKGFGYWSQAGGFQAHLANASSPQSPAPKLPPLAANKDYRHGYPLLDSKHVDDNGGWKLEQKFIPRLALDSETTPIIASKSNVVDWDSWYSWRMVPKDSPAALLMHFPLSVYQLLVHVLRVANPKWGSPSRRQKVVVHYVGAEVELNFIPIFAELALLLPYYDIQFVMFGVAVRDIVRLAKQSHTKSLLSKAVSAGRPIYEYTAPPTLGSSTLSVHLYGECENWGDPDCDLSTAPDVVVGMNAGLLSYPAWTRVIQFCFLHDLPFGVTEYAEQSAETQVSVFPQIVAHAVQQRDFFSRLLPEERKNLTKTREYPIKFNPFQRPGQRGVMGSTRLPNAVNGFTICIVGRDVASSPGDEDSALDLEEASRKMAALEIGELD